MLRTKAEVDSFRTAASARVGERRAMYETAMYEGCIPQLFWFVTSKGVKHNREVFESVVTKYRKRMAKAYQNGYGLLFMGDNGTGKTMFLSYLLGRAVVKQYSVYYTTLSQLDNNIKRGFDDKSQGWRLTEMLRSDFLAVDELGKEHYKSDGYLMVQLESVLKQRYDDGQPTLLASNLEYEVLSDMYGPTISSMLEGRYTQVRLEGGDYRLKTARRMARDMDF